MSTSDDDDSHPGLTIAAIGGGALLVWLLWRGGGTGWRGGNGRGNGQGNDKGGGDRSVNPPPPPTVVLRILPGDRLEFDGVESDLATTIARARAAGGARVVARGDARAGWVKDVIEALRAASVSYVVVRPLVGGDEGRYHEEIYVSPSETIATKIYDNGRTESVRSAHAKS